MKCQVDQYYRRFLHRRADRWGRASGCPIGVKSMFRLPLCALSCLIAFAATAAADPLDLFFVLRTE